METQTGRKSTSQLTEILTIIPTQTAPMELHEKVWMKKQPHLLAFLSVVSTAFSKCFLSCLALHGISALEVCMTLFPAGLRSGKGLEVYGWSRIAKNTRSRIFYPTPTPQVQLNHFLHRTPKHGRPHGGAKQAFPPTWKLGLRTKIF